MPAATMGRGRPHHFHKSIYLATHNEFFWPIGQLFSFGLRRMFMSLPRARTGLPSSSMATCYAPSCGSPPAATLLGNGFWLVRAAKSSADVAQLIVDPPDDAFTVPKASKRMSERIAFMKFGEFDHRSQTAPTASLHSARTPDRRCSRITSITTTHHRSDKDYVMIMTEMVHDARVINLGTAKHLPAQVRPWFGNSIVDIGKATRCVVRTTKASSATQLAQTSGFGPIAGRPSLKITERFTRTSAAVNVVQIHDQGSVSVHLPAARLPEFQPHRRDEFTKNMPATRNYALPGIHGGPRGERAGRKKQ